MIRTKFYFASGNTQSEHDCATIEEAFDRCVRMNMHALVHPVGTTCGGYEWRPNQEHTLDGFRTKLALCCNDPAEYSQRLIDAGICAPHIGRFGGF